MSASFNKQAMHLLKVGYPRVAVATAAERFKKSISSSLNMVTNKDKKRVVGIPPIHSLWERLKMVESRYSVNISTAAKS